MKLFRRDHVRAMSCMAVGRRLQHYLDGELDDARTARIAAHLEQCLRCGLEADAYEHIKTSLAQRGPDRPDDPALERLRAFADHLADSEASPS